MRQCRRGNALYAVGLAVYTSDTLCVGGSSPSPLWRIAQRLEQQSFERRFESCSRIKRDSSAVEHYTVDVAEAHRFLKNGETESRDCLPADPLYKTDQQSGDHLHAEVYFMQLVLLRK